MASTSMSGNGIIEGPDTARIEGDVLIDTTDGDRLRLDEKSIAEYLEKHPDQKDELGEIMSVVGVANAVRLKNEGTSASEQLSGQLSDDEESGVGGGGGNWIRAMAKALGVQADKLANELDSMAQNIGSGTGEGGNSDGVMPSNLALFNAAAGEFQLFMSCITKALEAANKGSQSLAQ